MNTVGQQRMMRLLKVATRAAAVLIVVAALGVLAGWEFHVEMLKRVRSGFVAMNPVTAVCFLAAGMGLWGVAGERRTRWRRWVASCGALFVLVIAAVRLAGYFGVGEIVLDQWLFKESIARENNPTRMAPNTAVTFILTGLSLLMLGSRRKRLATWGQLLAISAGLIAWLAVLGYAYSVASFYGVREFIPMALHTAVLMVVLALGLLTSRAEAGIMGIVTSDTAPGALARRLMPAAILIPSVVGWLRVLGENRGYYGPEVGLALTVTASIVVFVSLVWWNAALLNRSELQRRRAERALRAAEERTRRILETCTDAFVAMDVSGRISDWNPQAERIFGWERREIMGRRLVETLIPPQYREAHERGLARFLQTGEGPILRQRVEITALNKEGVEFPIELTINAIRLENQWLFAAFVHDITARRKAQGELIEKNRLLDEAMQAEREAHQALKRAQSQLVQTEKLASLGQTVAGVAHEINNPLSFVSNNMAVLQRETRVLRKLIDLYLAGEEVVGEHLPDLRRQIDELAQQADLPYLLSNLDELLDRSRDGLRRIQEIVKDLRYFARLDEGDRQDADLNAGIESTINIVRGRARKRGIEIVTELAPVPAIACYPAKLNQVVMNLLSNAIDASEQGGKVTVRTGSDEREQWIEVEDRGRGIDPAIRERIFDPFFTTKPPGEGTGLGLSISYGIVEDHGGRIEVESTPGKGSKFRVRLPQRSQTEQTVGQSLEGGSSSEAKSSERS